MREVTVSVPGKIHLIGEHTVVYGYPAIIASTNRRVTIKITDRKDQKIVIVSKNLEGKKETEFLSLKKKSGDARKNWEEFINKKDVSSLKLISNDPLDYILFAVFETFKFYKLKELENGFSLNIDSEIPIGSGSGSSAAIAVGVAAAVTLFLNRKISKKNIFEIALSTEELKHGTPSGGDPATVMNGGLILFQKSGMRVVKAINFDKNSNLANNFYTADTGRPHESTGEMISKVRKLREENPRETDLIFKDQERLTKELISVFSSDDASRIQEIIKKAERNLEKLGVVSDSVKKIIREIEEFGGAAKISGAGGRKESSGMLLIYSEKPGELKKALNKYDVKLLSLGIGEKGLTY